jgi:tetratricopeptide (TPR) repeat protein
MQNQSVTDEQPDIDLIERYHRGLLEEPELGQFIAREKTDRDFADKVRSYRELFAGIEYYAKQKDFADTVAAWEHELKAGTKKNVSIGHFQINRTILATAAAVLLLIIPLGTWWVSIKSPDARLAPYEDITRVRSGSTVPASPFTAGMVAYNRRDYTESASLLQTALQRNPDDYMVTFYLAESYLALNKTDSARVYYQQGEQLEINPLIEISAWRFALTYLKDKDLPGLKASLQKILADKSHSYYEEAEKLYSEYWKD